MGASTPNFPYAITKACTTLHHAPDFSALPDGFLRIVIRIVQKINLSKPFSSIFASRSTLAEESGKSLDSVHRAVKWLEDNGFIERQRKAKPGQRGSTSALNPTGKFLESLGILDSDVQSGRSPTTDSSPASGFKRSNKPNPAGGSPGNASRGQNGDFVRVGSVSLPRDLVWLCSSGLSTFGVLSLMRAARKANQKLSDIANYAKKYLADLGPRQTYAYLSKLVASGKDFAFLTKKDEISKEQEEKANYLQIKLAEMDGLRFKSKKTGATFYVDQGIVRELASGGVTVVHQFSQAFVDAVHEGKLVAVRG